MLTEREAWALLTRYRSELTRSVEWFISDFQRHGNWHNGVREQVDLIVHSSPVSWSTPTQARCLGARTRLTLAVLHAVSCCRGLEVATNQTFWRRVVVMLRRATDTDLEADDDRIEDNATDEQLMERLGPPGIIANDDEEPRDPFAFSLSTFAQFGIEWLSAKSRSIDDAYWRGFFHGTPAHCAVLAAVLDYLRPHMAVGAKHSPLRVSLSRCDALDLDLPVDDASSPSPDSVWVDPVVTPAALRTILRAALALPTDTMPWPAAMQFGLVVDYRMDYSQSATCETLKLLARTHRLMLPHLQLSIERLAIQLAPPTPPRFAAPGEVNLRALVSRGRGLGLLLRRLLVDADSPQVDTVALMWASFSDYRLVGAVLSAVAETSTPVRALRCSGLFDATRSHEKLLRLAWFAFALHRLRHRQSPTAPWSLSLLSRGVAMTDADSTYIMTLLERGTPLRDAVGEALRLRCGGDDDRVASLSVECLRLGSTVRLASGTKLYFEPFHSGSACVAATIAEEADGELELVAHVVNDGGSVAVVYAGYGLVWANAACVVAQQRLENDADVTMADEVDEVEALSSLTLHFENTASPPLSSPLKPWALRVAATVPLLASATMKLHALTLDRCVVTQTDLTLLLCTFPHLTSLSLDRSVVESLTPLIDAWTERRLQTLTVVSLVGVRDLRFRSRFVDHSLMLCDRVTKYPQDGDAPVWLASFLVDALLTRGVACGVLRELYVDLRAMASERDELELIERLAQAVAASTLPLTRLHITCRDQHVAACSRFLAPLRDVVLRDPSRVRCAVLSVLRVWGCAVHEIARIVLAMAEGLVVRTITWDWVENA